MGSGTAGRGLLAAGQQPSRHSPLPTVRMPNEEKRAVRTFDDAHGADSERGVETTHREPTRRPGQASKHVKEEQMAPTQHPSDAKRLACAV